MEQKRPENQEELLPFGEVLQAFRTRKGISQRELAARLGVHRNTVGLWERGDVLPASRAVVLEVAKQLGLDKQETLHLLRASLTDLTIPLTEHAPSWNVPLQRNTYFK